MSALPHPARPAALAVAAAALSVAALWVSPLARALGDRVIGSISSASGDAFDVAQSNGDVAVRFTATTMITETVPARRGELTVGSCIKAGSAADSGATDSGAITAEWVTISTAVDGKCPQRNTGSAGTPIAGLAQNRGVRGVIDVVDGDAVTVTRTDAVGATSQATVTLTDTTDYRRRLEAAPRAIARGKCVIARGIKDADGVLHATNVSVWSASGGRCPEPID